MAPKGFYRYPASKAYSLYWILFAYLVIGFLGPAIGFLALICMVGPVACAIKKGRWWCGNVCPRGNMYDKLLIKYSPHRPIPAFVRTRNFRLFMVVFIFTVFGVQMYMAWGNWNAMGKVFWNIILLTTVVGIVLSFVYAPRTWCSFCPMGTISSWVSPRKKPFPHSFTRVYVDETCLGCKRCARVCPMQLAPYVISGQEEGYLHPDCMKCGKCVEACPAHVMALKSGHSS